MIEEFKKFGLRGNAVDLAIGVIIGAAFGAIVNSLVVDIISPIIGAVTGGFDFSNYFLPLSSKVTADSLVEAKKQGAVLAWGSFLTIAINFIIIAWVLFLVVKLMNQIMQSEAPKTPAVTKQEILLTEIREPVEARARMMAARGMKALRYHRGRIGIVDRGGLEARACECYEAIRRHIEDVTPAAGR